MECAHIMRKHVKSNNKNVTIKLCLFSGLCEQQGRFARRIVSREDSVRSTHSEYQYGGHKKYYVAHRKRVYWKITRIVLLLMLLAMRWIMMMMLLFPM